MSRLLVEVPTDPEKVTEMRQHLAYEIETGVLARVQRDLDCKRGRREELWLDQYGSVRGLKVTYCDHVCYYNLEDELVSRVCWEVS